VTLSFRAKQIVEHDANTIADGLSSLKPKKLAFETMAKYVDDVVMVDEGQLLSAIRSLLELAHVLAEPAAAAALAGAFALKGSLKGKRVVLVITGANVTMDVLRLSLASNPLLSQPGRSS
jgi:threonine dehydratase